MQSSLFLVKSLSIKTNMRQAIVGNFSICCIGMSWPITRMITLANCFYSLHKCAKRLWNLHRLIASMSLATSPKSHVFCAPQNVSTLPSFSPKFLICSFNRHRKRIEIGPRRSSPDAVAKKGFGFPWKTKRWLDQWGRWVEESMTPTQIMSRVRLSMWRISQMIEIVIICGKLSSLLPIRAFPRMVTLPAPL